MCILCVYESCGQALGTVTVFDSKKSELNLFLEIVMFKFPIGEVVYFLLCQGH